MRKRTLSIYCQKCGTLIFSYFKVGKGQLIRCWKNRIIENNTVIRDAFVYCPCGQLVGLDNNLFILLKKYKVDIKK